MFASRLRTPLLVLVSCAAPAALGQTPAVTGVLNAAAAGRQLGLCPGVVAGIVGQNFGTAAAGLSVTVGGAAAFVTQLVSPQLVFVRMPVERAPGSAAVVVTRGTLSSAPFAVTLESYCPAILTAADFLESNGSGPGAFLGSDGRAISTQSPALPGERVTLRAYGLGPTNPVVATGTPAPAAPPATTLSQPTVTIGGLPALVSQSGLVPNSYGLYQAIFTVPNLLGLGSSHPLTLTIGGRQSNTVVLAIGPTPAIPLLTAALNAVTFESGLSPGMLAAIFGSNFGTNRADLIVTVGGYRAHVLSLTTTQMDIQIPVEAPLNDALLVVERLGLRSLAMSLSLGPYSPALLPSGQQSQGMPLGSMQALDGTPITERRPAVAGERVLADVLGLGATDPRVPTGTPSPSSPLALTLAQPIITIDDQPAEVSQSLLVPGEIGRYRVRFLVPSGLADGVHTVRLEIGGMRSNSVGLVVGKLAPPAPVVRAAVSSASFGSTGMAVPGAILAVFADNLGTRDVADTFPATEVEGVSVTINGVRAPIFGLYPPAGQINLAVPNEAPESGDLMLEVRSPNGASPSYRLQMLPADPGIFRLWDPQDRTRHYAAATLAGTRWFALGEAVARRLALPVDCAAAGIPALDYCAQPIRSGDYLVFYLTGLGKATPGGVRTGAVLRTGDVAPPNGQPLYETVDKPTVRIGGLDAEVSFSGLTPGTAGLYQINAIVPAGVAAGDEVVVTITMPNGRSDTTRIAVTANR